MTSLTYRRPAGLAAKIGEVRADYIRPPSGRFFHDGKLNFGPALLLAATLSAGFWAAIFTVGVRLFH